MLRVPQQLIVLTGSFLISPREEDELAPDETPEIMFEFNHVRFVSFTLFLLWIPAVVTSLRMPKSLVMSSQIEDVSKSSFPLEFLWGTSSSAYQVEGAWNVSNRGKSNWDTWSETLGNIKDNSTAQVANNHYYLYQDDITLLKDTGFSAYRFSLSWSRLMPTGEGNVNLAGVAFYNEVIDSLLAKGIIPFVTLFHFDIPQTLDDKYLGWLNESMVGAFTSFADICFSQFGDRVKNWITLNEPGACAGGGWGSDGHFPPGRCTNRTLCLQGNSSTEPYVVVHNMLRAHASASHLYNTKYKAIQGGQLGMAEIALWYEPASSSEADKMASERALEFQTGWILDPIFKGDYPLTMKKLLGERLPTFSTEELKLLNNSLDFIGLNHYLIEWASDYPLAVPPLLVTPKTDMMALTSDKAPANYPDAEEYYAFSPKCSFGMSKILEWVSARYPNVDLYITENGYEDQVLPTNLNEALSDYSRIEYHKAYIAQVASSIRNGIQLKGYFAWAFMDSFEWNFGYLSRYGLFFVERPSLIRFQKRSAIWFSRFLRGDTL